MKDTIETIEGREVHFVDFGIASVSEKGIIYINRNLKSYDKELYEQVLQHELKHDVSSTYSINDLKEDWGVNFPLWKKIDFCRKYPGAWTFLLPIVITEKDIFYDWLGIFKWLVVIALIIFTIFITWRIL